MCLPSLYSKRCPRTGQSLVNAKLLRPKTFAMVPRIAPGTVAMAVIVKLQEGTKRNKHETGSRSAENQLRQFWSNHGHDRGARSPVCSIHCKEDTISYALKLGR